MKFCVSHDYIVYIKCVILMILVNFLVLMNIGCCYRPSLDCGRHSCAGQAFRLGCSAPFEAVFCDEQAEEDGSSSKFQHDLVTLLCISCTKELCLMQVILLAMDSWSHTKELCLMQVIAERLSEEEIGGLRQLFKMIDADNNGTITFEELQQGLRKVGSELMESEIMALMNAVYLGFLSNYPLNTKLYDHLFSVFCRLG